MCISSSTEVRFAMRRKRMINRIPLWVQLSFFTFVIISTILAALIFHNYTYTRDMAISNQTTSAKKLLNLELDEIDRYISDLAYFCAAPYYDTYFTKMINQKGQFSSEQTDYIKEQMHYNYYTRTDIIEYEIYFISPQIDIGRISSQQHVALLSKDNFNINEAVSLCSSNTRHEGIIANNDSNSFFTYYHSLVKIQGQTPLAIVRIKLNNYYANQLFQSYKDNNSLLVLLNREGDMIMSSHPALISSTTNINSILSTKTEMKNGAVVATINSKKYLVVDTDNSTSGVKLINFIPLSIIDTSLIDISGFIFSNGFIYWLAALFIIYLLFYYLLKPLNMLSENMLQVGAGDFSIHVAFSGSKEISNLSKSFNFMIVHINELIQKNYISRINEKDAKLQSLEAQLNPHFLYNTLQAISTEAIRNDQFKINQMIITLASCLRYTIKGGDLVPLNDELNYLSDYEYLQKTRMGDSLEYSIMVDEDLNNYLIPKICLQTLVENSIVHGYSKSRGTIHIKVTIVKMNENIKMSVSDDGIGISNEQLDKLKTSFKTATTVRTPNNIGLANLYARLKLLYDAPTDFIISSRENEYTEIVLILPIKD